MAEGEQSNIAVDPDYDSALDVPLEEESSLASLQSSIRQYLVEHGRSYHSLSAGKYMFPNDEGENDRLDIQHQAFVLALDGELCLSPNAKTAQRVLDLGTGTGVWAMEFAEAHPQAEVIGVDLSPIQPSFVPPNCSFEIDDLEKEWTWSKPFDYIFGRMTTGSLSDPEDIARKAFEMLKPGGVYELQDIFLPGRCDDGSVPADAAVNQWTDLCLEAAAKIGREYGRPDLYEERLKKAGFVDIVVKKFIWPINSWPKDPKLKEVGKFVAAMLNYGIEGLSMAFFTRALGWTEEEVTVLCAKVRQDLRNLKYHHYWKIYVVYGTKPEDAPAAGDGNE